MVLTRFLTKQHRLRALKRMLGQDILIETGRGCISGTLMTVRSGERLVLRLKNVRIEGDNTTLQAAARLAKRKQLKGSGKKR